MIMLVRKKFPHLSLGSLTLILDSSVIILGYAECQKVQTVFCLEF